ncbi:MBL fold metallo-hydrolase [Patescibacteria group bacterium]|nr:MBL fold metallo-hydrolase [Patescibacteria group bacterium]
MQIKSITVGPLATNCYLLIDQQEMAIVDPGAEPEKILKQVTEAKVKVNYIINTHFHFDHILANRPIKEKTKAQILIHQNELEFIDFVPDRILKENDKIKIGESILKVIHTPGHSLGSICLLGRGFILTGDTLFKNAHGRVDFPGGSLEEMEHSLEKLANLIKPGTKVYPGHGEIFNF